MSHTKLKHLTLAYFEAYLNAALNLNYLIHADKTFDLEQINAAIKPERDLQFTYLGLQTLYDRYFIHCDGSAL